MSGTNGQILFKQHNHYLRLIVNSGSSGILSFNFPNNSLDTNWNHFAVTLLSSSAGLETKAYKNGQLQIQEINSGASYNIQNLLPTSDCLNLRIAKKHDNSEQFAGSLDEFRFWKTARTPEQIYNYWFTPIGGGTNNYESNISLGCYFKFNEGITGNSTLDKIALDYSGRINNGTIVNYVASMRNTGSAIREKLGESEFLDPIIYSSHPDVVAKKAQYKTSGSLSDNENTSMFFSYFPA